MEVWSLQNTQLVEEADDGNWGGWPQKAGTRGVGLFLTPKEGKQITPGGGPICTAMSSPEEPLAATQFYLCLLRHSGDPMWEDSTYAWALQFWAEKVNLPTGRKPCLWAGSVKELQEEMGCYLSFSNVDVFKGVALLEETSAPPTKEASPESTCQHPWGGSYCRDSQETHCREEAPKQVPWLREGVAYLPTCGGCWADPPSIKRPNTKALQLGRGTGSNSLNWGTECGDHPAGAPLTYQRVGSHLVSDATSWFPGSDGMSVEGPIARRGLQSTPKPIDNRIYGSPWNGNHEHKLYCERWSDRGHLHGHCNHLNGERDPQWPWTGDLSPGAYNTGHNRRHLKSNQITAFGWQGEPTTTVEWLNQIMTVYGWIRLPMTASGQRDYNAIGW